MTYTKRLGENGRYTLNKVTETDTQATHTVLATIVKSGNRWAVYEGYSTHRHAVSTHRTLKDATFSANVDFGRIA
jgi:hypothetical protein